LAGEPAGFYGRVQLRTQRVRQFQGHRAHEASLALGAPKGNDFDHAGLEPHAASRVATAAKQRILPARRCPKFTSRPTAAR
jgi:hypothetical protein